MRLGTALITLLLCANPAWAAALHTYSVPTQHQLPEQLKPLIEPLLAPGGVVTHFNNHLIIKTTEANYREIEPLIRQFDQPAQQLLISLRSPSASQSSERSYGVSGTISSGSGRIEVGDGRVPEDGIRIGRDEDQAYYRYGTHRSDRDGTRQIRTLEGSTALITTGVEIPEPRWSEPGLNRDGYKKVEQGFYVTVRLAGNGEAIIEIRAQNDQLSTTHPRRIETQEADTVLRAPLGQWVRFGDLDSREDTRQQGLTSRQYRTGSRSGYFEIMVEPL